MHFFRVFCRRCRLVNRSGDIRDCDSWSSRKNNSHYIVKIELDCYNPLLPLPPFMVPVSPLYGQVLIVVCKCLSIYPSSKKYVSASPMNLHTSCHWPRIHWCVKLSWLCLQMLKERSWSGIFFLWEDNANRQRSKNPLNPPSGGRVQFPDFQVLIFWILEVGGSPNTIFDLHGRTHETF